MRFLPILLLIFSVGCSSSDPTGNQEVSYRVANAFPNLSFDQPVDLQHAGDNSGRLFVVERAGVIRVFNNESSTENTSVFLDIRGQVDDRGAEEGLLGLAFHPNYESNGYFYVNYTASDPARTVIARFQVSEQDHNEADTSTEQEILSFAQPYDNHNGGQLAFGPDGYLYIAVGDGGSGGDPQGNGQNRGTLLGSILRIDVDGQENDANYAIPPDNPYTGNDEGYREEIFAHGLRNPWRFSFDAETGRLWAGDVGQSSYEEIDIIENGNNYGWNIMEGTHCYEPSSGCDQSGLTMPVWEYGRNEGISVTGGYVYRGPALENLTGKYIYGDYGSGKIWALDDSDPENPTNVELLQADFSIPTFGVDAENKLYICGFNGNIYQLEEMDG
jgi:glucose/arabinose dehydrogenase